MTAKREFATVTMDGDEILSLVRFFATCEQTDETYDIMISTTNTVAKRLSSILSADIHQGIETLPPHFRYGAFGSTHSRRYGSKKAQAESGPFAVIPGMPGRDPFTAAKNLKYVLELFHAFHLIYPNEADWDFPHSAWVYEKLTGGLYHSTISEYVHHGLKIASKKTYDEMLSKLQRFTLEKLRNEDVSGRKILSALRSASAASRISEGDARLISIWSAFEALLPNPSRDGENTVRITHFESYITPLVTSSYVDDMYRNFFKDVSRNFRHQFNTFLDKGNGGKGRYASFLDLFFADADAKREFTKIIARSELLLHRAHELDELANDPKKLKAKLSAHETRVSWQLHRIYRARNSIVHSGISPQYCPQLTENAFSYFKSIMTVLVRAGDAYGVSNSDALFELCASICRHRKKALLEKSIADKKEFFFLAVAPPTVQATSMPVI